MRGNGGSERGGGIEGSFDNLGLLVIRKLCGGGGRYVDFLAELGGDFGGAACQDGDSVAFCEGAFDEDEAGGAGAAEDEEVLGCHWRGERGFRKEFDGVYITARCATLMMRSGSGISGIRYVRL